MVEEDAGLAAEAAGLGSAAVGLVALDWAAEMAGRDLEASAEEGLEVTAAVAAQETAVGSEMGAG